MTGCFVCAAILTFSNPLMYRTLFTLLVGLISSFTIQAQDQTVGLFTYDTTIAEGYTLLAPYTSHKTYLINNCGHEVNSWESEYTPGANAYLLSDGSLLRSGQVFSRFMEAGGNGGILERYSWDGELIWSYQISNDTFSQHHDFEVMPNGNILVLIWERIDRDSALNHGRKPELIMDSFIWAEKIIEIKPVGSNSAEVVWEWRVMDHLIQDEYSDKEDYGTISDHPERIDFNSHLINNINDWLHFNSLDYNADLDQILISCHAYSEIYIIDHSTTTSESSGHFGGVQNMGGDIIYRWGNPQAYDRGTPGERTCFKQHDAQWIPKGYPNEGKVLIFNNGTERKFSSIDMIIPPTKVGTNTYVLEPTKAYGPDAAFWSYTSTPNTSFFSTNMGGVQPLKDGGMFICQSAAGRIFQLNSDDEIVWDYTSPITMSGPLDQGDKASGNGVFRSLKYPADYKAFEKRDLKDGLPLEGKYLYQFCDDTTSTSGPIDTTTHGNVSMVGTNILSIWPNPASDHINVELVAPVTSFCIRSMDGRTVFSSVDPVGKTSISVSVKDLPAGTYLLESTGDSSRSISRIIVQ